MQFTRIVFALVLSILTGCNYKDCSSTGHPPAAEIKSCTSTAPQTAEKFISTDQKELLDLIKSGKGDEAFDLAFERGDGIFSNLFTREQGIGAKVTADQLFTRIPRADLTGTGEWATHKPTRPTGPNAQSCASCHNQPDEDGAGPIAANVHRDPLLSSDPKKMIQRNTPHLFGMGALQRLAEEMTSELLAIKSDAGKQACKKDQVVERPLIAKGVNFGNIMLVCRNGEPVVDKTKSIGVGIDADLVIRPLEWKKSVTFIRDFVRAAAHREIGMQGVEVVGRDVAGKPLDGDSDGKQQELTVGDITAVAVYMAAQPRPTTRLELDDLGLLQKPLTPHERKQIQMGEQLFNDKKLGCAECHKPMLSLRDTIFTEPSQSKPYRDTVINPDPNQDGAKVDLVKEGVLPQQPVRFDLSADQPDNVLCKGDQKIRLGSFTERDANHQVLIRSYGDLKRHFMGDALAESIDELHLHSDQDSENDEYIQAYSDPHMGLVPYDPVNAIVSIKEDETRGKATFGTKELWGVGCTGPWMHDGRATTLTEAIMLHGGEAEASKNAFKNLPDQNKKAVLAFMGNLVLYMKKAEDSEVPKLSEACDINNI